MSTGSARCFVVYAVAPEGISLKEANERFNRYVADPSRGLALFHDHFVGRPGGMAIFFVENGVQRTILMAPGPLDGWTLRVHPLVYSHSPSSLDEQIAYTLRAYRGLDWEELQQEDRPCYGRTLETG